MSVPDRDEWPDGMEMIRQVRDALGMFAGAMPITPKEAWGQALDRARTLAGAASDAGNQPLRTDLRRVTNRPLGERAGLSHD